MADQVWTPEQMAELRKLWQDGYSASIIGMKLGFSRNAVIGKVHRMRLPDRKTLTSLSYGYRKRLDAAEQEQRRKAVAEGHAKGWNARHLAQVLRVTVKHARNIARAHGMPFGQPTGRSGGGRAKQAGPYLISFNAAVGAPHGRVDADDAVTYEIKRRAMGALPFIARLGREDRCKWPLDGESGMHMMTCCAKIPYGSTYCGHHRLIGTSTPPSRRLEAAE